MYVSIKLKYYVLIARCDMLSATLSCRRVNDVYSANLIHHLDSLYAKLMALQLLKAMYCVTLFLSNCLLLENLNIIRQ